MGVEDYLMHRVLVDTGSSINLLMLAAFQAMKFSNTQLTPVNFLLVGLSQYEVLAEGSILLRVNLTNGENQVTVISEFIVVDSTLAYNALVSIKNLSLHVPITTGFLIILGDRNEA